MEVLRRWPGYTLESVKRMTPREQAELLNYEPRYERFADMASYQRWANERR
jgi:hypothetical protein